MAGSEVLGHLLWTQPGVRAKTVMPSVPKLWAMDLVSAVFEAPKAKVSAMWPHWPARLAMLTIRPDPRRQESRIAQRHRSAAERTLTRVPRSQAVCQPASGAATDTSDRARIVDDALEPYGKPLGGLPERRGPSGRDGSAWTHGPLAPIPSRSRSAPRRSRP